jgi:hypothetical protein
MFENVVKMEPIFWYYQKSVIGYRMANRNEKLDMLIQVGAR